jgi:hypothetical protein
VIKRRALALKNDPEGSGKYVAGLNEIRVRTRDVGRPRSPSRCDIDNDHRKPWPSSEQDRAPVRYLGPWPTENPAGVTVYSP